MNSQRSDIPNVPKMGVRARVAEWPPRAKVSDGSAGNSGDFRPFHRSARRAGRRCKDAEFQAGFSGIPLRQRSSSEATLSECDPEETPEARGNCVGGAGLFREYGSTSSIDVQGIPEQSFFEMLDEFRTKKPEFCAVGAETPRRKEKPRRRCVKNDDSVFKKLRNSRHDGDAKDPEEPRVPEPAKSWICRKGFAHFDVQSIFFEAVSVVGAGTRRRNTATGASAASAGSEPGFCGAEDSNRKENLERDLGDDTSNELLLSCPHFRNEIGGGRGERDVSFAGSASPATLAERGAANAGVSVLEPPRERPRNGRRPRGCGVEHADLGARYYREYFHGKEHSNYFGVDDKLGPVAVSARREKLEEPSEHGPQFQQRLILRTSQLVTLRGSILEDAVPSTSKSGSVRGIPLREILEFVVPELTVQCLRLALATPKVTEQLLKLDEQGLCRRHKVGILYCKAGQSSEEEMYNNEAAGPALEEFLTLLGEKVTLKSFTKYAAQLDTKTDSTGTHSLYTTYQDYEIMFHVSTMLPYTPNNRQQVRPEIPALPRDSDHGDWGISRLLRKRHIGNDIVTIIFQEPGALPFTPQNIRSHFQHVFIIVRAHQPCSDNVSYSVAVTRSKDVPPFGPPVPPSGVTFRRSDHFRAFLLAKAINAENAAHKSHKFRTMATRTRQEYLRDLAENYVTNTPLDTAGKFNLISLASKKKEKSKARPLAELESAGAVSWRVSALDFGRGGAEIPCVLGISKEFVVLVDLGAKEVVFNCFTGDVIGWSAEGAALRIYHGRGDLVSVRVGSGSASGSSGAEGSGAEGAEGAAEEVKEIVQRLKATTPGCATVDMTLRRNGLGQLGFHVHPDGSVAEVEEYGFAWQAGLRRGSRLLEVCKVAAVALSHEQMIDLLRTSVTVTVGIVPPHEDGTPRRPLSFPESPHSGAFRQTSGSFSAPERPQRGAAFPAEHPGHSGNSGNCGHSEAAGIGHDGGNERIKAEPLWHVPAPARIPGKRPARPDPGGKDSPNRLRKAEAPPCGHSPLSSSASSEAEAEGGASDGSDGRKCNRKCARNSGSDAKNSGSEAWSSGRDTRKSGSDAKNSGSDAKNFGSDAKNSGNEAWSSGKDARKSGNDARNSGNDSWNFGNDAWNSGKDTRKSGNDARNSGNDAWNSGKDTRKSGNDSRNSGSDGWNSGNEAWSSGKDARKSGSDTRNAGSEAKNSGNDAWNSGNNGRIEAQHTTRPQIPVSVPKSFPRIPGRAKIPKAAPGAGPGWRHQEETPESRTQVNVFGQPRLRASLRDLRSPRRLPKSSIEDDLKRLILMDNSCPEPETAPGLQRTLSDESLCGSRRESPGNGDSQRREFPENFPGGFPGSSTLPGRRGGHPQETRKGPVARLDPGLIPLPDTAGLEWATLVSAAKAYEVQRAVSLFSLADPAPSARAPPLPPLSPSPTPLDLPGKVSQLEAMLKQLHSDLEKEKQDKVFLQAEVANLRQNNRRLQQESSSAARQLRRFARIFSGEHQEP
ncbi:LOW QUALITY PROTEIN: signal-induced proliferation-associated 1-like protein 3 [Cinclus cinclus]